MLMSHTSRFPPVLVKQAGKTYGSSKCASTLNQCSGLGKSYSILKVQNDTGTTSSILNQQSISGQSHCLKNKQHDHTQSFIQKSQNETTMPPNCTSSQQSGCLNCSSVFIPQINHGKLILIPETESGHAQIL